MRARPARAETTGGALAHRTIEHPFPKPPLPMSQRTASSCPSQARYNSSVLLERDPQAGVLKALRGAGGSLLSELASFDEDILRWRPGDDEWSLKGIAAHLRDAEELAIAQLNAFASGASKPLPVWDVDLLPQERDYQGEEIDRLLASFRDLRRGATYLLGGLTDADWGSSAQHPYRGEVTLGEIAHELAQHDLEHLWQVRRLKERLRETVAAREDD